MTKAHECSYASYYAHIKQALNFLYIHVDLAESICLYDVYSVLDHKCVSDQFFAVSCAKNVSRSSSVCTLSDFYAHSFFKTHPIDAS